MIILRRFLLQVGLLALLLGFVDGILTALALTAARMMSPGEAISGTFALRVAASALASGAFVFFVARYAELREELTRAEKQLNVVARGRFAMSRLGREVFWQALISSMASSVAAFLGALVPLMPAALVPQCRWISVASAVLVLALLGATLARAMHGSMLRWSCSLAFGGGAITAIGTLLRVIS